MSDIALAVSRVIEQHFIVLWLAVMLAVVAWSHMATIPRTESSAPVTRARLSGADIAALGCLAILIALYAFVLFYRAELAEHDQYVLTTSIIEGEDISLAIWPNNGRFFPLGHQEFNLLRHFAGSINGYLSLAVLQLVLLCVGILALLRSFSIPVRALVILLLLVTPSVVRSFQGLIYSERNLVLLLVLIALGLRRHDERPSRWVLAGTLVATHFALFYKEPVFLLVAGVAGCRLLIDWWSAGKGARPSIRQLLLTHRLELGMLALVIVFLLFYAGTILPHRGGGPEYTETAPNSAPSMDTLLWYLRTDPILLVLIPAVVIRAVVLVRGLAVPDRLWDSLMAGALLYFLAYVLLGLESGYYLAPLDLVGILYLAEMARRAVYAGRLRSWIPVTLALLLGLVLGMASWYLMIRRKNVVHARAVLADYVKQLTQASASPVRVHIPMLRPYIIMEFGILLRYKGVRLVADSPGHATGRGVILEAPHEFPLGRCIRYRDVPCSRADTPAPGTVILYLADAEPRDTIRSLRPAHPAVEVKPFGIPVVLPALRWVMTRMQYWDETRRTDWLWAYAEVANE